jgi:electron transfer flavoprotein alpha subunit
MAQSIWVLAEQWRGKISDATYEVLALGREIADGLGAPLEAVLLGDKVKGLAGSLGAADTVVVVDHPSLAHAGPENHGELLGRLAKQRQPLAVLVPMTNVSWDIIGSLPAQMEMPFVNFCENVEASGGKLTARCLLYGGKMQATMAPEGAAIYGIMPGARQAEKGKVEKSPAVEEPAITPVEPTVKFKNFIEPDAGEIDITQMDVLISVGRGMQNEDNMGLAEELAEALGGAVSGSRPVIDQGWLPLSRQVGKSGATVKPKLYVAAGISGAPEHVEGMKNADLIIGINTDAQAPIFNVAHYGVVEDATDVLEALTKAVRAKKG